MLLVTPPKQELVLLPTMKMIASGAIPELGLVLEDLLIIPTRVETRPSGNQTMERSTLKRCAMFLYNNTLAKCKWFVSTVVHYIQYVQVYCDIKTDKVK